MSTNLWKQLSLYLQFFHSNYQYWQFSRTYLDMPATFIKKSIALKLNNNKKIFLPLIRWIYVLPISILGLHKIDVSMVFIAIIFTNSFFFPPLIGTSCNGENSQWYIKVMWWHMLLNTVEIPHSTQGKFSKML